jgi:FixJ family two-component response regulator
MANVLIVDDNLDTVELCSDLLESAGHRPDCVLLDVDMPVLSGPGMAHQMLLHDAGEEGIPILLVSGRGDLSKVAEQMGTPYFLAKATPGYGQALFRILDQALRERRAPTSA